MARESTVAHGPEHGLERLIFFSDAVFAIVITLLVIEIHAPHIPHGSPDWAYWVALINLTPEFIGFFISFFVIGFFWAGHHRTLSLASHFSPRLVFQFDPAGDDGGDALFHRFRQRQSGNARAGLLLLHVAGNRGDRQPQAAIDCDDAPGRGRACFGGCGRHDPGSRHGRHPRRADRHRDEPVRAGAGSGHAVHDPAMAVGIAASCWGRA